MGVATVGSPHRRFFIDEVRTDSGKTALVNHTWSRRPSQGRPTSANMSGQSSSEVG